MELSNDTFQSNEGKDTICCSLEDPLYPRFLFRILNSEKCHDVHVILELLYRYVNMASIL